MLSYVTYYALELTLMIFFLEGLLRLLSWFASKNSSFYLKYDPITDVFDIDKKHPYYYQMQQQIFVTKTNYALLVVGIEKDLAVVFVPRNEDLCDEIRIRCKFYFRQVIMPQLMSRHFYANHPARTPISDNLLIDIEMPLHLQTSQIPNHLLLLQFPRQLWLRSNHPRFAK